MTVREQYEELAELYEEVKDTLPKQKKKIHADWAGIAQTAKPFIDADWADSPHTLAPRQALERKLAKFGAELDVMIESTKDDKGNDEDTDAKTAKIIDEVLEAHKSLQFNFLRQSPPSFFRVKVYDKIDRKTKKLYPQRDLEFTKSAEMGSAYGDYFPTQQHVHWYKRLLGDKPIELKLSDSNGDMYKKIIPPLERSYNMLTNTMDETLEGPDHRVYNTLDPEPLIHPQEHEEKIECPWIFKCLGESMGSGKAENERYFHKWIYTLCWGDPGNPMTPILVFFGKGRGGKGFTFECLLPKFIQKSRIMVAMYSTLSGNFNKHDLGKTAILIDEVPPMNAWNLIKYWSGSKQSFVDIKHGAQFEIENTIARAIASNSETYPLPFEDGKQMDRVSPMKMEKGFTFGEVVTKRWNDFDSDMGIEDYLRGILNTEELPLDGYTEASDKAFKLGDILLKSLPELYEDPDTLQQYADWLHQEFSAGDGRFILEPLRGQDWADIAEHKEDPAIMIVDTLINNEEEYVAVPDLMAIYEALYKEDGKKEDRYMSGKTKVTSMVQPIFEAAGYVLHKRKRLYSPTTVTGGLKAGKKEVGKHCAIFVKSPRKKYVTILDKYIVEIKTPGGAGKKIVTVLDHNSDVFDEV